MLDALRAMPANGSFPRIVGAHVEGPFLSPERLGTHPLEHRRDPDLALLDRLLDAGRVTEFTLAPELPGADALIKRLLEREIVVSAGHTNATAAQAHAALRPRRLDRLAPLQRDAAVPLARSRHRRRRADAPDVYVQMIVDGHHLADETVRLDLGGGRRPGRARQRRDRGGGRRDRPVPARRHRDRHLRRRADARRRRLRRHGPDDDRGRAEPARARDPVRGRGRRRDLRCLRASSAAPISACSSPAALQIVVVLDDRLEIVRVLCGGEARVVA